MRIVILSTETPHHIYFINCIAAAFEVAAVFYETEAVSFLYDTSSPFALEAEKYENKHFFTKIATKIPDNIMSYRVNTINSQQFIEAVKNYAPDLGLVFGCGRIRPHIFPLFKKGLINVHRGISTFYRGLDSDLWAIYHNDFTNIGVTLHYVKEDLDTGDILAMRRIRYTPDDKIYHLRYKTTVLATEMMISVISALYKGEQKKVKQLRSGRYYSAMPKALKPLCVKKFERYIHCNFKKECKKAK